MARFLRLGLLLGHTLHLLLDVLSQAAAKLEGRKTVFDHEGAWFDAVYQEDVRLDGQRLAQASNQLGLLVVAGAKNVVSARLQVRLHVLLSLHQLHEVATQRVETL